MQLSIGSHWISTDGKQFVINDVRDNGGEVWVNYCRLNDNTYYTCLAEAFTHRFQELKQ